MKSLDFGRCELGICAAAAMLAGCGGSQPPVGGLGAIPITSQSRAVVKQSFAVPSYKASSPLLYVAGYDAGLTPVYIYKANVNDPKPIAAISKDIDNASGACIDSAGTLYVTNSSSGGSDVLEYALGQTKLLRVITKGIETPGYCAIDASGNFWVTNIGLDNVAEYLKGSTKPHGTITKGLKYPVGIAIDHAGNLYVGNNMAGYSQSNIQVYAPGAKSPSRTITDGITWPVGIAVDAHGTLYVANNASGRSFKAGNVEEYLAGQNMPYRTIRDELVHPTDVLVNKSGWLYVATQAYTTREQTILEYRPHSLKPSRAITKGIFNPSGLAYYPPLLP